MKKLFCIVLFSIGFFAVSQAQILIYSLENQSAYDWEFKMGDNGGNGVYYANIPATSPPVTGVFNGFVFSLQFGGQNSIGCSAFEQVFAPTPGSSVPFACWVPAAINYNLVQIFPGVYSMTLEFS